MGAASIGPVDIEFALKNMNFDEELAKMKQQIASFSETAKRGAKDASGAFDQLRNSLAAFATFSVFRDLSMGIVDARGEMQQLSISLETFLKSKTKADALTAQMVGLAARTPFELKDVAQGGKQLLAYGIAAKEVIPTLTMLGDVAAGTSTPIGDLVYLYGTAQTQGRLYTRDIMQFAGRGIPIIAELSKQLGVSQSQVMKLVEEGKVGFSELQKAFTSMTSPMGMFGGLMEKQSKSITGQLSNLKDAWYQAMNDMGKDNEGLINDVISGGQTLVAHWREVADVIKVVVATYGTYKAATMVTAVMQEVEAAGSLTAALQKTAVAQGVLNMVQKASPVGIILTGVTALIGAYVAWDRAARRTSEGQEAINKAVGSASVSVNSLFEQAKKTAAGTKEHADAIKLINDRYGDYLSNLLTEKSSLNEIEAAQKRVTQAMIADAGAKAVKGEMDKILANYNEAFNKNFGDYLNSFSQKMGADRVGEFMQALSDAVDKEVTERGGVINRTTLESSQNANKLWQDYMSKVSSSFSDRHDFIKDFLDVAEAKSKMDPELRKMQSMAGQYEKILELYTTAGKKAKTGNSNEKTVADEIDEKKKQYELYYKWVAAYGENTADKQFKSLISQGKSYREYLLNEINKGGSASRVFSFKTELADVDQVKKPFDVWKDGIESAKSSTKDFSKYIDFLRNELSGLDNDNSEEAVKKRIYLNEEIIKSQNKQNADADALYANLLEKAGDYTMKKKAIDEQYAKDVAVINSKIEENTTLGKDEQVQQGKQLLESRKQQYTDDLDAAKGEAFKKTDLYKKINEYYNSADRRQLQEHIVYLQQAVDKQEGSIEQQKKNEDDLAKLKKQLRESDLQHIQNVIDALGSLGNKLSSLGGTLGDIGSALSESSGNITSMIQGVVSGNPAQMLSASVSQLIDVYAGIYNNIKAAKKAQEEYYNSIIALQNEYNLSLNEEIRLRAENNENIFNTDYQGRITSAYAAMTDAQEKYNASIAQLNDDTVKTGSKKVVDGKLVAASLLSGQAVVVAAAAIFGKKSKTVWSDLLSTYQLINKETGEFDANLAQALIDQNLVNEATKQDLQQVIALQQSYEEAKKQLSDTLSTLAGDLGSNLEDALKTAFENGTDAAAAMFDAINGSLGNMISQMAFAAAFQADLTQLQADMTVSLTTGDGSVIDDFAKFYNAALTDKDVYNQIMQAAKDTGKNYGLDLFSSDSGGTDTNSLSGSANSMSEDTASLITGQMNAIRINQVKGIGIMDSVAKNTSTIALYTVKIYNYIKDNSLRGSGL